MTPKLFKQAFPGGLVAGQVAIITGSGQGIGRSAAILFAQEGASVVVTDIDAKRAEEVAKEITSMGGKAIAYPGDITADSFPDGIVKATIAAFGKVGWSGRFGRFHVSWQGACLIEPELTYVFPLFPPRSQINHIVNNAGFTFDGMIHKMTDAQWDIMIKVHNTAPFRLIRAAAEYMRVSDGEPRAIVNISSTSGIHGNVGQIN